MKTLKIICLLVAFLAVPMVHGVTVSDAEGLKRAAAMKPAPRVITIDGRIELATPLTLAPATVLEFGAAGFVKAPLLGLDGVYIQAPARHIMDVSTVQGVPSNTTVCAQWAAPYNAPDQAPAVNLALTLFPANIVDMGGGVHNIKTGIEMNLDGQRLQCAGVIRAGRDTGCALRLKGQFQGVDINSMQGAAGTGVRLAGDNYHDNIRVGAIEGFDRGIELSPDAHLTGKPHAGVQYCRIEFGTITARYGVYIDLYRSNSTWVNENRVGGGRINAPRGIYVADKPAGDTGTGRDRLNGNLMRDMVLDSERPLTLRNSATDRYEHLVTNPGAVLDIADCHNTHIVIDAPVNPERVLNGEGNYNTVIEAPMGNGLDRMHLYHTAATSRPDSRLTGKYLTTSLTAMPMAGEYTPRAGRQTVTPWQLRTVAAPSITGGDTSVLCDIVTITTAAGQHVTICDPADGVPQVTPLTIVYTCNGGSLSLTDSKGRTLHKNVPSGTYRLGYDSDMTPALTPVITH